MADGEQTTTGKLTPERVVSLSQQLVEMLNAPVGFRNGTKAGMLLVFACGEEVAEANRRTLIEQTTGCLMALGETDQQNVAAGLAETREYLEGREPGLRTMLTMSLWEELIAALPLPLQHRAREGQLD